jgi:uroporphyrinogen III methyltransferase/synthase
MKGLFRLVGIAARNLGRFALQCNSSPRRNNSPPGKAPALVLPTSPGRVYLVGAGPGDPRLITLRGVQCLAQADVVVYDYLVNPQVLEHARPGAELVCLGRHGTGRILTQDEINARLVSDARAGRTVVRLKGGDPAVFARAAEEIQALAEAGIPFEIVPGITAALAAGSHAGISLTHRELASAVALVTGHEQDGKPAPAIDYAALAAFPGTLVFYMGVTSAGEWSDALVAAGKPPATPVAIVRRCSLPDQETLRCTLGTLADVVARHELRPPAIMIVGDVVTWEGNTAWFAARPLVGQRVLVTRPLEQSTALRDRLQALGAQVDVQPAIRIEAPSDWKPLDDALRRAGEFNWIAFSSSNGVNAFFERLAALGGDARWLARVRLAAIGPGTAAALAEYHLRADLVPDEFRAEALADSLASGARGQRFLLVRASRGREVLAERLQAAGGIVEQVVAYQSIDVESPEAPIAAAMAAGQIDWVTVTSSAIARSLVHLFGDSLGRAKLASISPITSATLRELGHEPTVEARQYTTEGLVEVLVERAAAGQL